MADCPACRKTWTGEPTGECKACDGTGKQGTFLSEDCAKCRGTGNCVRCGGSGRV